MDNNTVKTNTSKGVRLFAVLTFDLVSKDTIQIAAGRHRPI